MPSFIVSLVVSGLLLAGNESASLAQIAVAGDPPTIYRLLASEAGPSAIVAYGRDPSGEAIARWELKTGARSLEVTRDGGRACVLGIRPQTGRRRGDDSNRQWTLTVVDLVTGRATEPMLLALVPRAVTLLAPPGSEPKLLIAATDRIAAYSLDPPGTSWYYKSPGENRAIAAGGAALVAILRGGTLAIIDPARRPRIEGRLQLTDDDVTSTIDLGAAGLAVAMSDDGAVAAVLHEDRLTVSLIDVAAGKVMGTRRLSEPPGALVMRIVPAPGVGYQLMVASVDPLPSISIIDLGAPEPLAAPKPVAEPEPPPQAPPTIQPTPEPVAEPTLVKTPEPVPAPVSEPVTHPVAEPVPERVSEPVPPPVPPPQLPEPPPEPVVEPSRPSDEAILTGTISGDTPAAREVRFYGPNNILKLHAHATVGPDGTFRVTLPPPGSYRVIVTGDPGAHLFTRPEFRMVVVGADGKGVSGIDFEVRGRL